ncbi:MAG: class I SAM-dependent methyltransferase [Microscillaceae bacterium]|jgi:ubiquinone/menaquinone biosynthesis C-methylase UbiE|nr:class I SAM-dependent methyltransferase [Microscillaceae bacterium]
MKKYLLLVIGLALVACRAPKNANLETDFDYHSRDAVWENLGDEFEIYNFQKGEAVASVGAGDGWFEVANSIFTDSVVFYIQDIDRELANSAKINRNRKHYQQFRPDSISNQFFPIVGDKFSAKLPQNFFDKVLLRISLHHFSQTKKMLQSIHQALKSQGLLMIAENVVKRSGIKEPYCKEKLWSALDLIQMIKQQKFTYVCRYDIDLARFKNRKITKKQLKYLYTIFIFKKK